MSDSSNEKTSSFWKDPPTYAPLPKPGTYRITNVSTKTTVLEVLDINQDRVASSEWADQPNQRWIIQYSGRGYKIKNSKYDVYLTAPSNKYATIVAASKTPTIWGLMRTHAGFAIHPYGEDDLFVDLHYGWSAGGNVCMLWGTGDLPEGRRWTFDHISNDTSGEASDDIEDEVVRLKRELEMKDAQLAHQATELAKLKDKRLVEQAEAFATLVAKLQQSGRASETDHGKVLDYGDTKE
ncbi:hypothetical protein FRC07_006514, partial [Ceratobasidium sp. 392]